MTRINSFLRRLGWDDNYAIEQINNWLEYKDKKRQLAKDYYKRNKRKLDMYHSEYRKNNPKYRAKVAARARKHKKLL